MEGNSFHTARNFILNLKFLSLSLHLGNEIFDVYKQYMQGDHNHLFIHRGPCLQGQAVFKTKLAFRYLFK